MPFSGAGLQGHPHSRGCSFPSAAMDVPPEGSRNASPTYRRGNRCGQDLGVPDEPVSVPVCTMPTLLPSCCQGSVGAGAQVGAGAHLGSVPCCRSSTQQEMCSDVQGPRFGAGPAGPSTRHTGKAPAAIFQPALRSSASLKLLLVGFTLQMENWRLRVTKLIGNNKQQGPSYWKTLTAQAAPTLELPLLQQEQLHTAPGSALCRT